MLRKAGFMLMAEGDLLRFREVKDSLFGGRYTYQSPHSASKVLKLKRNAVLKPGNWALVVYRPQESLLIEDSAVVKVVVTGSRP